MKKRLLNVKVALLLKEITQADVAKQAGVNPSFISQIVTGREKPSEKVIKAFEKFGVEMEEN